MAETANAFMDRLVRVRDAARILKGAVSGAANEAPSERLDEPRGTASRSLAAGIKALGQDIVAEAERLERKL